MGKSNLKNRMYEIIFESDTFAGKLFDIILLLVRLLSVIVVMLESVSSIEFRFGEILRISEWIFTIVFTIEYLFRLWSFGKPIKYAFSFFGIVDFLSFIPTYIGIFIPGTHFLMVIRIVRLVRVFRIFKLARYLREGKIMLDALKASGPKLAVFLVAILSEVTVIGSAMYLIEGASNGFTSIPRSIYWAIVTMTTVGYGDISPKTSAGQFLAAVVMILGYAIIAVPTGVLSFDIIKAVQKTNSNKICSNCGANNHDPDAKYCKYCGTKL